MSDQELTPAETQISTLGEMLEWLSLLNHDLPAHGNTMSNGTIVVVIQTKLGATDE